jgi:hypothetical protein
MDRKIARRYLLIFGGVFSVVSLAHIWTWVSLPDDIWWTPQAMALTLSDAHERVEVYVRGAPFRRELEAGRVLLGGERVVPEDVRVRLNNHDRVKLERVPVVLVETLVAGVALVFLTLGATGWLPSRGLVEVGRHGGEPSPLP